jgi:DNA-directed RNA polymerase
MPQNIRRCYIGCRLLQPRFCACAAAAGSQQVSKYLADLTLDAIGEMFGSARAIMAWLADCARVVAAANAPVSWSSPLGLPIMQPYHKLALTSIQTATQSFAVSLRQLELACWQLHELGMHVPPAAVKSQKSKQHVVVQCRRGLFCSTDDCSGC